MTSLERYAKLFSERELRRTFLASVIARLPIGVTGLAILLLVQTASDSFARGGAAAACYVIGLAAYSAESVLIEIIFIVGPPLVALFVAFASAAAAVWFAAACGFVGRLVFRRWSA